MNLISTLTLDSVLKFYLWRIVQYLTKTRSRVNTKRVKRNYSRGYDIFLNNLNFKNTKK